MKRHDLTLYIGHNVDGRPAYKTDDICVAVSRILNVEGLTAYEANGIWKGESERTTVCIICGLDLPIKEIRHRISKLTRELQQEAIMYRIEESRVLFSSPITHLGEQAI